MIYLKWDDSFSVGNDELDDHHKHLVCLLNTARDVIGKKDNVGAVQKLLFELLDFAVVHFWVEERWMQEINYPFSEQHAAQHNAFIKKINHIIEHYAINAHLAALEVFIFLQEWLTKHILGSDGRIENYALASAGLVTAANIASNRTGGHNT